MKTFVILLASAFIMIGCQSKPSLQKYFVEKTEDKNFIALDVSPSILNIDKQKLTAEQNEAMATFNKMNILAFKLTEENKAQYETEKKKVAEILKDKKYQELMRFGQGKDGGSVSFVGDENHIDEFIFFANRKENGFAVVRILGEDMNPTGIMSMISAMQQSDIDLEQLKPLQEIMTNGSKQ